MTIDSGPLADDLYRTFVAEYENGELAVHIAADIDRACSLPDTVEVLPFSAETGAGREALLARIEAVV